MRNWRRARRWLRQRFAILILPPIVMMSTACSSIDRPSIRYAEMAYQAGHVIDVAQTINHGRDNCFEETNGLTRRILGDNPKPGETLAWGLAWGAGHYVVSERLEHYDAPMWLQIGWQAITITEKGLTIGRNHRNGIRPWGDNKRPQSMNDACRV